MFVCVMTSRNGRDVSGFGGLLTQYCGRKGKMKKQSRAEQSERIFFPLIFNVS